MLRTFTGNYLRWRLKRQLVLSLWYLICDVISIREIGSAWQPTKACIICKSHIGKAAVFCPFCGNNQSQQRETEQLRLPRVTQETEEIETQRLYFIQNKPIRLGETRPCLAQWAEMKRLGLPPRYPEGPRQRSGWGQFWDERHAE